MKINCNYHNFSSSNDQICWYISSIGLVMLNTHMQLTYLGCSINISHFRHTPYRTGTCVVSLVLSNLYWINPLRMSNEYFIHPKTGLFIILAAETLDREETQREDKLKPWAAKGYYGGCLQFGCKWSKKAIHNLYLNTKYYLNNTFILIIVLFSRFCKKIYIAFFSLTYPTAI